MKRTFAFFMSVVLLTSMLMTTLVGAAVTSDGIPYIVSNDKGAPVWTKATSSSKKLRTLEKDTWVTIIEVVTNSSGNQFGKTVNGTFIYMGNLTEIGYCAFEAFIATTEIDKVPLRYKPASEAKIQKYIKNKGTSVEIVNVYWNDRGNEWLTTSDGYEVWSGNLDYLGK